MKKIKLLTVTGSLVMASSLLAPSVANADIFQSGSNCEAANLNQALAGIGWSQGGVKNNSTTPFFVVCSIDWDATAVNSTAFAAASFPGSGTVECTVREQDIADGSFASTSLTVNSGQNTGNPASGFNSVVAPFGAGGLNVTVVCALDPGEGITWTYST